jgi:2-polyprenyl-3-methyl-5-hydroxy-6-metoxy-1,4-benzoquinol methylase
MDPAHQFQELLQACPGCAGRAIVEESVRNAVYSCAQCGLLFTNPRPTSEFVERNYCEGRYYAAFKPDHKWEAMWRRRVARVMKRVPSGRALDVGAGIGTQLSLLRGHGFEVCGTEISSEAVGRAKELYGLALMQGYAETLPLEDGRFDVVTLWHVFEHLPYPGRTLPLLVRKLRRGGFLFIAVPNNSFARLAFKPRTWGWSRARKIERLIEPVPYEKTFSEIHMIHFTPGSLRQILEQAGLEVVELNHDNVSLNPGPGKDIKYAIRNFMADHFGLYAHKALFACARKL